MVLSTISVILLIPALAAMIFIITNFKFSISLMQGLKRHFTKEMVIDFEGKRMAISEGGHIPSVDSLFMYKNLMNRDLSGDVLDIGTGIGALPVLLDNKNIKWVCTEINEKALDNARQNFKLHNIQADTIISDVFDDVRGKFDFIVWNFPFVLGSDTIMRKFIKDLPEHLKLDGKAYLLSSYLMRRRYPEFDKDCEVLGISAKIIAKGRYHAVPIRLYELRLK